MLNLNPILKDLPKLGRAKIKQGWLRQVSRTEKLNINQKLGSHCKIS
jgi:hypothetical protein